VCLLRPRSTGSVTLASDDPEAAPLIDPAFFKDPQDLEDMVAGFKITRQIMHAPSMKRWITVDPTEHAQTDDEIRQLLREKADTVYHPVGSCKMGVDEMAVVDPELKVYGIESLRIVDASIMPSIVGGNTNAPSIMIGEKAADLIRGTHRFASTSNTTEEKASA
jgi:choline dehydrogenase-like flavoprotein